MKKLIVKIKRAKEALERYISENGTDSVCKKIYNYIQNIDSLSKVEMNELDLFIEENTVKFIHLADIIYVSGINNTKKTLSRMEPYLVTKPDSNVNKAEGAILKLVKDTKKKPTRVIKKTYLKKTA